MTTVASPSVPTASPSERSASRPAIGLTMQTDKVRSMETVDRAVARSLESMVALMAAAATGVRVWPRPIPITSAASTASGDVVGARHTMARPATTAAPRR
jgi:hypothetical protein